MDVCCSYGQRLVSSAGVRPVGHRGGLGVEQVIALFAGLERKQEFQAPLIDVFRCETDFKEYVRFHAVAHLDLLIHLTRPFSMFRILESVDWRSFWDQVRSTTVASSQSADLPGCVTGSDLGQGRYFRAKLNKPYVLIRNWRRLCVPAALQ